MTLGEDQDRTGEDGRRQQGQHHPAHGLPVVGAEVGGCLLVLLPDGHQPGLDDDGGPAQIPGDEGQGLRDRPEPHRREQDGEHEEHGHAENELGNDEGEDQHEIERRCGIAAPPVDTERERHTQRHGDHGGIDGQAHGLDNRGVQVRIVQHRIHRVGEIPAPGESLPDALRLAVIEGEKDSDPDRHQRPEEVEPGESLKEPRVAPRVAPRPQPGQAGPDRGARAIRRGRGCGGRGHIASRDVRFVLIT